MLKQIGNIFAISFTTFLIAFSAMPQFAFAALSCTITTAAGCSGTVVLRMSSSTNAHAEVATGTTPAYANSVICCTGISGVSCNSNYNSPFLRLSSSTNAHVEIASNSNYQTAACMSDGTLIPVIVYQDNNCTGYETSIASISSTTNAHVGTSTEYTKKVCGSLVPPSLSFALSTTTAYFGTLSPVQTRYASSTAQGDQNEVEALNLQVKTNALSGYFVTVQGATLTSGANTIIPLGNTNTAPAIGSSQFGIRLNASGGSGTVSSPYSGSGFAYDASATATSVVASCITGDNATTTYSVRMMSNISSVTKPGSYTTTLFYVATANF